jgi:hypothetical protein
MARWGQRICADSPEEEATIALKKRLFFLQQLAAMTTKFPSPQLPQQSAVSTQLSGGYLETPVHSVSCDDQASASLASATACCEPAIYAFGWSCMADGWLAAQLFGNGRVRPTTCPMR